MERRVLERIASQAANMYSTGERRRSFQGDFYDLALTTSQEIEQGEHYPGVKFDVRGVYFGEEIDIGFIIKILERAVSGSLN